MKHLRGFLNWIDNNILLVLSSFLIAFIPLFPKIPLFDILPGYIVRVRVEDFLVILTACIWLVQAIRSKIAWKSIAFVLVLSYALVGVVSIFLGTVLLQTIPQELLHIGKSALHFFRYIEYFALFFFTFSAIKTKKHVKLLTIVLATTVLLAAIYGFGQKYLHWPLYSTMNREYSKGVTLYLSEFARIQSTFAGHYDLTAFLVLVLPLLFTLAITASSKKTGTYFHITHLAGLWLLVVGASKSSLVAYAITILIILAVTFRRAHKSIATIIKSLLIIGGLSIGSIASILFFAPELYKSTAQLTKNVAPLYALVLKLDAKLPQESPLKLQQENTSPTGKLKPDDVYVDIPDLVKVATTSATGETTYIIVEKERTWSDNALKYGLSMGIRLDTLWPQALKGFARNPLTGSAYATLNKEKSAQYTEADSTDNNYLRVLGETGLLGVVTFFSMVLYALYIARINLSAPISLGFIAGTVGLLINASTIDVFAASKVAFTFWAVTGIVVKNYYLDKRQEAQKRDARLLKALRSAFSIYWPLIVSVLFIFFASHTNPFTETSSISNFATNPKGAEHITAARCFMRTGNLSVCRGELVLQRPLDFYALFLVPFLAIYNHPGMFYFANSILAVTMLFFFYKSTKEITTNRSLQILSLTLLITQRSVFAAPSTPNAQLLTGAVGIVTLYAILARKKVYAVLGLLLTSCLLLTAQTYQVLLLAACSFLFVVFIKLLPKLAVRKLSTVSYMFSGILLLITFFNPPQLTTMLTAFRDEHDYWRYRAVQRLNTYFYNYMLYNSQTSQVTDPPKLITALNPYYVDMFSNGLYSLVPLSAHQEYFDTAEYVWGRNSYTNLTDHYNELLQNNRVFVSNSELTALDSTLLYDLNQSFDLYLEEIGCDYTCNIYQLFENTLPQSPQPKTLGKSLQLETLASTYSFAVVPLSLDTPTPNDPQTLLSTTKLLRNIENTHQFTVGLGDILATYDQGQVTALRQLYLDSAAVPLLFVPSNTTRAIEARQSIPQDYHYFFGAEELFLTIVPDATGEIPIQQQRFIFNTLLELEKLPQIKTVFIFMDRAGWIGYHPTFQELSEQSRSRAPKPADTFIINQLLPNLEKFTDKRVFIVSGDTLPEYATRTTTNSLPNSNLTFIMATASNRSTGNYISFEKINGTWHVQFIPVN